MPEQHGLAAGDVFGIAVTLALTFVLGLEREEAGAQKHAAIVTSIPPGFAVTAVLVSIASNNVVKGLYALALGDRRAGGVALAGLSVLAVLTLLAELAV
jgi:hypothetical protein